MDDGLKHSCENSRVLPMCVILSPPNNAVYWSLRNDINTWHIQEEEAEGKDKISIDTIMERRVKLAIFGQWCSQKCRGMLERPLVVMPFYRLVNWVLEKSIFSMSIQVLGCLVYVLHGMSSSSRYRSMENFEWSLCVRDWVHDSRSSSSQKKCLHWGFLCSVSWHPQGQVGLEEVLKRMHNK